MQRSQLRSAAHGAHVSGRTVHRFLHAFWAVRQRVMKHAAPVLEDRHDLRLGDYFLLQYVAGSALAPGEIAEALDLPAHHVSRHLDALERQGLIERSVDPRDARRRVLTATRTGHARLQEATGTIDDHMREMLGVLDAAELIALVASMEALAKERTA